MPYNGATTTKILSNCYDCVTHTDFLLRGKRRLQNEPIFAQTIWEDFENEEAYPNMYPAENKG